MPVISLERRLQAARPEVDDGEERLAAMVASRLFGPAHATPARVGRFSLLERIGRGGSGDVYAAYDPLLDRKVALKLLRADAGRMGGAGWLLREARAAARLTHPNVVAIHEVGEVGDEHAGIYVAMEFIAGTTLRAWLAGGPALAQILDVFVQAGRGLGAAHEVGVIHRDFKPENVLIGRGDGGEPRCRVVDFGLAHVAAAGEPGVAGGTVGTPAYMAPEQLLHRPVDARSDQFSFCVALHEALTGRHPFAADEPDATGQRVLARVLAGDLAPGERAAPAWLQKVVRRGLAPDPADRYPSMHALVRELEATPGRRRRGTLLAAAVTLVLASSALTVAGVQRWTAGPCGDPAEDLRGVWDEQVRDAGRAAFLASGLAHAGDVWTRLEPRIGDYAHAWRVAREQTCRARHTGGAGLGDALQLRDACLLRRRAELAGLTALLARADPETISAGIAALDQLTPLTVCDDAETLRREATALGRTDALAVHEAMRRELVTLGTWVSLGHARVLESRVAALTTRARERASPVVLAEALQLQGRVQEALGDHDAAAASLTAAVHEAVASRHDRLHAELAVRLVWIEGVLRRRSAEASTQAARAAAAIRAIGGEPLLAARLLDHRGAVASAGHDHPTAERLHREAIELRTAVTPRSPIDQAMSRSNLGLALLSQGKIDEAEANIRAALDGYQLAFGPQHPTVAAVLSNLGQAQVQAGRHDRGLELLHAALRMKERTLGPGHVALISTLNNLGSAHSELGHRALARHYYLRALAIGERELGPDSPRLEYIFHNLAFEAWQAGAHAEVIRQTSRALELQRRLYGDNNPILAPTLELLARGQLGSGQTPAAAATIERALTLAPDGTLEPVVRGSLMLSAAVIRRAAGAEPAELRPLVDTAAQLLGPAPDPDHARELAALRSP
ncbi:MAG: serine/threonine protein kinase [Myxococcales bacterium]|nr:serine/threonine protein kinase [Myxococcales bacterium]